MISSSNQKSLSAFRKVFGQEKNKDILIGFLNDMLQEPEFVYILDAIYLDSDVADKTPDTIVVQCTDQYKRCLLIEIYIIKSPEQRRTPSGSGVYDRFLKKHGKKGEKAHFVFMTILEFTLFHDIEELRSDFTADTKKSKDNCIEDMHAIIIELPKFEKEGWELKSSMDCWYYLLKHVLKGKPEACPKLAEKYPMIKRAYEALEE
ncbi:MAG: PD-(D/E)XK nuclease family transposase [Bacteroidota bacterium]